MLRADIGAAVALAGLQQAKLLRAQRLRQHRLVRFRQQVHQPVLHGGEKCRERLRIHALLCKAPAQERQPVLRRNRAQIVLCKGPDLVRFLQLLRRIAQQCAA